MRAAIGLALVLAVSAANAAPITIDDFASPDPRQQWSLTNLDPDPTLRKASGPGIVGGERDLLIDLISPNNPGDIDGSGQIGTRADGRTNFEFQSGSDDAVTATLQYDGFDVETATTFNNARLLGQPSGGPPPGPGIDLTGGGTNNAFLFDFFDADGGSGVGNIDLTVILTSLAGGTATFMGLIPDIPASSPDKLFQFLFASFVTSGSFSFTEVDSIEIIFNERANIDVDFTLDNIRVGQFVIQEIPEPASIITMAIGCVGFALLGYRRRQSVSIAA
jgi:hypothetical protein